MPQKIRVIVLFLYSDTSRLLLSRRRKNPERKDKSPLRATMFHARGLKVMLNKDISSEVLDQSTRVMWPIRKGKIKINK